VIRFILGRLLQSVGVLLLLSVVIFAISRLSGSPVDLMLPEGATEEQRTALVNRLRLDRPLWEQYLNFIGQAVRGDFGVSSRFHTDSLALVLDRFPNTAILALSAIGIAVVIGIPLGSLAALRRGWLDQAISTVTASAQAMPSFWFAILLILLFGVTWQLLPISQFNSWASLVLPAVSLSLLPLVTVIRVTRSSVLSVVPQHYVDTAKAKGLPRRVIVWRHILRNALIPVVTVIGLLLASALSGAVITEQIFSWPGIGSLAIEAIKARDYSVVQCVAMLAGATIIIINLLVDISYRVLDPRARITGEET
jgi:peptide/nickel transport system permease protein